MRKLKKSTRLSLCAVVVSVLSLVSCFSVLGISNSFKGTSIKENREWNVYIDSLSIMNRDEELVELIKEPTVDKYKVSYGVKLNKARSNSQFEFTIRNDGNIDAEISEIIVTGIDQYSDYVKVKTEEENPYWYLYGRTQALKDVYKDTINENTPNFNIGLIYGTILKEKSSIVVKVLTDYVIQYSDENFVPQIIELDDISIEFKMKKLE